MGNWLLNKHKKPVKEDTKDKEATKFENIDESSYHVDK